MQTLTLGGKTVQATIDKSKVLIPGGSMVRDFFALTIFADGSIEYKSPMGDRCSFRLLLPDLPLEVQEDSGTADTAFSRVHNEVSPALVASMLAASEPLCLGEVLEQYYSGCLERGVVTIAPISIEGQKYIVRISLNGDVHEIRLLAESQKPIKPGAYILTRETLVR